MKQYLCVQCDEPFGSDETKPRCPTCMRVNGIHPLDAETGAAAGDSAGAAGEGAKAAGMRPGTVPALVVLVALVVGGVYLTRDDAAEPAGAALGGGPGGAAIAGLPAAVAGDPLAKLLESDAAIAAFASQASAGTAAGIERARGIVAGLRGRAKAGAFIRWSMAEPRNADPLVAAEAYAQVARDGAHVKLHPLEVAAVAVAAIRSTGDSAQLVEVFGFEGDRSPPDPSGRLGYYGVLVGETVLDPYAGRELPVAAADRLVLSDAEAVAAALALRSGHRAQPGGDMGSALRDAQAALQLQPRSATVRSAHAFALLVSGAAMDGLRELESAQQQRDDAPRNLNVGFARMASGEFSVAAKHIARALELAPDYALGHLNLSRLHLAQADRALARASLERAESLDPKMPVLALAWAGYHLAGGELQEALARSERAVEDRPDSAEARITLARVHRGLGHYDEMRRHAHALLEMVSPSQRERTKQLVLATLGPTALEEPEEDEEDEEGEAVSDAGVAAPSGGGQYDLMKGSKLLGGSGSGAPKLKLKL